MMNRLLQRLDGDDPGTVSTKIRAFQVILVLVVATEYWTKALRDWVAYGPADHAAVVVATLLAAVVVHGRWRRVGFAALALLQTWWIASYFPLAGNHRYLELFLAALFVLHDDSREAERVLLLRSLRWTLIVVLFYSGLQKCVHGYWHDGQFLAWSLGREPFRLALRPLFSPAEFERLASLGGAVGDGPYSVTSLPLRVVSNVVWLSELALAALLFARRTRAAAAVAAFLFVVATEAVARELMFGVEFAAAMALFARSDLIRRLVLPAAVVLALLVLARGGVIPGMVFH
jgi:hypothetical protein